MNRWLRGGLALCAGFGSTVVAIDLADTGSLAAVAPGSKLGGLDLFDYCRTAYGDRASAVQRSGDAYGWRCWETVNRLITGHEIVFDDACRLLYGSPAYAESYNVSWPYSWECFRGPKPEH